MFHNSGPFCEGCHSFRGAKYILRRQLPVESFAPKVQFMFSCMCTDKRVKLRPFLPLMVGDFGGCASRGDLSYKISDNPFPSNL